MYPNSNQISPELCSVYPDLASAICCIREQWCDLHGYTEPFCHNGVWWVFPPNGVIPVRIRDVMNTDKGQWVRIGRVSIALLPDGSFAHVDI